MTLDSMASASHARTAPSDARMAARAISAKAAVVYVISGMTVAAFLRQLHFIGRLHVAGLTQDLGVGPF